MIAKLSGRLDSTGETGYLLYIKSSISGGETEYIREYRSRNTAFPHESTGVHGRGTEEVKTNDVSGRVQVGEVGFTIEFGRPSTGCRCWKNARPFHPPPPS